MRIVIQRVTEASVIVAGQVVSKIGPGILVSLGIFSNDTKESVDIFVDKILKLRLWNGIQQATEGDKQFSNQMWQSSVIENNFQIMLVSQFALAGVQQGNKPDFHLAAQASHALDLYKHFVDQLIEKYSKDKVSTGSFQEYMKLTSINDGPITMVFQSGLSETQVKKAPVSQDKIEQKQQNIQQEQSAPNENQKQNTQVKGVPAQEQSLSEAPQKKEIQNLDSTIKKEV